jgi:hypothetical protein
MAGADAAARGDPIQSGRLIVPLPSERTFYRLMRRAWDTNADYPVPWWVQQSLRGNVEQYDTGLFDSPEAAFASNALYRYWAMVGIKDHQQESLVGQAGEIEPVYDAYSLAFFLVDVTGGSLLLPQQAHGEVTQEMDRGYLPVVMTRYQPRPGVTLESRVLATTIGQRQRGLVLDRLTLQVEGAAAAGSWLLGVAVLPAGPSGFQRHDRAGRYLSDRRLSLLRYSVAERRFDVNTNWGPLFDTPPAEFGLYGNTDSTDDPGHYLGTSPFADLRATGHLNGATSAADFHAGMCTAAAVWPLPAGTAPRTLAVDVRMPLDDFRGPQDLREIRSRTPDELQASNETFWTDKLDHEGTRLTLGHGADPIDELFKLCRANLLVLSDDGVIHPGPTIYDSFWVRDSAVEGIACALNGDINLAERQFGTYYPRVFSLNDDLVSEDPPVRARGFFGAEHEWGYHEWDSNGQALWAFGRLDRILGGNQFGAAMFNPYVAEGARWIRDNRDRYGLLKAGWSAEHLGPTQDRPHYWDDLWSIAGLYEATRMADRLGAVETDELRFAYDDLRIATRNSILYVVDQQRRRGRYETFVPTGPGNIDELNSTIVGALAYYHPCRLHDGQQLGPEVDEIMRLTVETIWARFVDGGFKHDTAWQAYGPYLTLQLAHTFLLLGDLSRMASCLDWALGAAYADASLPRGGRGGVVSGGWNEQHSYAVGSDFHAVPFPYWYMGDMPHGWACAEFTLLIRALMLDEADEDGQPTLRLCAGVLPKWLPDGAVLRVTGAPTAFGTPIGYELRHNAAARTVALHMTERPPPSAALRCRCPVGRLTAATGDGQPLTIVADMAMSGSVTDVVMHYT